MGSQNAPENRRGAHGAPTREPGGPSRSTPGSSRVQNAAGGRDAKALRRQGGEHERRGELDRAAQVYIQSLRIEPDHAETHAALGRVGAQIGRIDEALKHATRAVELEPGRSSYHANRAIILHRLGRFEDAFESADRAVECDATNGSALGLAAACLEKMHRLDDARARAERALQIEPDQFDTAVLLGRLLRRDGELEKARELLERTVKRDGSQSRLARAWHELGLVLDRLHESGPAFEAFTKAAEIQSASPLAREIDPQQATNLVRDYRMGLSRDMIERATSFDIDDDHASPFFLVGFPRSGTTMTEQILGAHPDIVTSGEALLIHRVRERLKQAMPGYESVSARLGEIEPGLIAELRAQYWCEAEQIVPGGIDGRWFLDKLPLNCIDLGLINIIFPGTRVIMLHRDPRDACLSCYMQLFGLNAALINFLSWTRTGAFYAEVMDLWLFLREIVTLPILEIRYEDIVDDLEASGRKVLAHLGLPWNERLLSFQERARAREINTPSYEAVTKTVNRSAVARWKRYKDRISEIEPNLRRFIDAFGYGD